MRKHVLRTGRRAGHIDESHRDARKGQSFHESGERFVIPLTGDMMRMPGLPLHPAAEGMTLDVNGQIHGLS